GPAGHAPCCSTIAADLNRTRARRAPVSARRLRAALSRLNSVFTMIVSALLLAGLVKVLIETENPQLCAGIYSALLLFYLFVGYYLGQYGVLMAIGAFVLGAGWALLYFRALNRLEFGTGTWWLFLIVGLLVPDLVQALCRWLQAG